jgi:hypothetical protein
MNKGIGTISAYIIAVVILLGVSFILRSCEQAKEEKHEEEVFQEFDQQKLDNSLIDTDEFLSELMKSNTNKYSIIKKNGYDVMDIDDGVWLMTHRVEGDRSYTKGYENNLSSVSISYKDLSFITSDEGVELLKSINEVLKLGLSLTDIQHVTNEYYLSRKDIKGCFASAKEIKLNEIVFSCYTFSKFGDYSYEVNIPVFNEKQAKLSYEIKQISNKQ